MKLVRLKITDSRGFRSLQKGFEYHFRAEPELETAATNAFAPFVCAGPNGSGKSNLLEALAVIFYQLEVQRVRRSFLPDNFPEEEYRPPHMEAVGDLDAYELEYEIYLKDFKKWAHVTVHKKPGESPETYSFDRPYGDQESGDPYVFEDANRDVLLPEFVLGYSSGENEILSLPFFKMRFIQFDEYWNALQKQLSYPGRPETRMAYMDSGFSQAILICNLLYYEGKELAPFREEIGIDSLKEFRVIIRRTINVDSETAAQFGDDNPAINFDSESGKHTVNLMKLLEADIDISTNSNSLETSVSPSWVNLENLIPSVTRLKNCATCYFVDEETDTLVLDYWVNEATRKAFSENFDFEANQSPIALFQAFQVLLTLNLYCASSELKGDLYNSDSLYVNETVPTLASDERIMRFKNVQLAKEGIDTSPWLKSFSDGEHQLLHSLGLCLLFKNTNSLILFDEPETHFNPDWRSNFITRLGQCFEGSSGHREMLITTHTPFLISDSKPEKVLIFNKNPETREVSVKPPEYNTLGASINKITMNTFKKRETIGGKAQAIIESLKLRLEQGDDKDQLLSEIDELGDSIEKIILLESILGDEEAEG